MTRLFTSKMIVIGLLSILFLLALTMLSNLVSERQRYNQSVIEGIGRDYVNPQTIVTPFILIPTTITQACQNQEQRTCIVNKNIIISPTSSVWNHQVKVSDQNFKRGIYKAITYTDQVTIKGKFSLTQQRITPDDNQIIHWEKATIRLSITDLRGLINQPTLNINGQKIAFNFPLDSSLNSLQMSYTEAPIILYPQIDDLNFNLDFSVNGLSSLNVIPLGGIMRMTMTSNWPHPSFFGTSLPQKTRQSNQFTANWQNTYIANQNTDRLNACLSNNKLNECKLLNNNQSSAYSVKFINAVDTYTMSNRTIKYGLLFILITFGTFFMFEALKNLRIHPMQYTLVATALGVFYLLLLSFSEQFDFAIAYLGSSTACVLLISFYVYYMLKGFWRTILLMSILSSMYVAMYLILQSEDLTLTLGSVLVFILIAATMILTRKVDWYNLTESK